MPYQILKCWHSHPCKGARCSHSIGVTSFAFTWSPADIMGSLSAPSIGIFRDRHTAFTKPSHRRRIFAASSFVSIELDECMSRGHACQGVTHVTGSRMSRGPVSYFASRPGKHRFRTGSRMQNTRPHFAFPPMCFLVPESGSSCPRPDIPLQLLAQTLARLFQVVVRLEPHPEALRGAEVAR